MPYCHQNIATPHHQSARQRGAAAVLAMMFLVIFGSLAAAMAIVSQGNLRTADSHLKINRSLAAAETGMNLLTYRLEKVTEGDPNDFTTYPGVLTADGLIHDGSADYASSNALALWSNVASSMVTVMLDEPHYVDSSANPYVLTVTDAAGRDAKQLHIPAIQVAPGAPSFEAVLTPHPIVGEDYDSAKYDRPPFDGSDPTTGIDWDVSAANPLDARFIQMKVTAYDGELGQRVYRSVIKDFRLHKVIPYAVLSRSRVMIGRNVLIKGNVGSRFMETHLDDGHPIQMESDFRGLNDDLDDDLDNFIDWLKTNDIDNDNRLNIYSATETAGLADPAGDDLDGDGYITDFDLFLAEFDTGSSPGQISLTELTDKANEPVAAGQLFQLMDNFGNPNREGYADDLLDADDLYTKVKGELSTLATASDWNAGAADGSFKDYLQGTIDPTYGKTPLTTGDTRLDIYSYEAATFDTSSFVGYTTELIDGSAPGAPVANDVGQPTVYTAAADNTYEAVPYGAAYPYDYYQRPVYENMEFENVKIAKGTNALFKNCRFIGVTFLEIETYNGDENYNYAGMQDSDGSQKHPDKFADVNGTDVWDTKTVANNVRFDDCTFEGAVVSGDSSGNQPTQFAHVRNKVTFTGNTQFKIKDSTRLSDTEKERYSRSAILLPHVSVEMGSFNSPAATTETVELSGTIVAGLIDMRGQVTINGTLISTFEPVSGVSPVIGDTSPQFNTTLGYFSEDQGDLESELPAAGLGMIQITYDPSLALPDGVTGPITMIPIAASYTEGGQ